MRARFPGWRTGGSFRSLRYGTVARAANRNVDPCWIFWAWNQDAFAALWLVGWDCWPPWRPTNWQHESISAMGVWRVAQRLGQAAASYSEALSQYHADSRSEGASVDLSLIHISEPTRL